MSFFTCTSCQKNWENIDTFLKDKNVDLIGYQMSPKAVENGLFLFNHRESNCGTTIGIQVNRFISLFKGVRYTVNAYGLEMCEKHCKKIDELASCRVPCANAFARDILQAILKVKAHKE